MRQQDDFQGGTVVAVGTVVLDRNGSIPFVKHAEAKQGAFCLGKGVGLRGSWRLVRAWWTVLCAVKEERNLDVADLGPGWLEKDVR